MADRSLRFDLIARDKGFSRTLDQMGRKGQSLNRRLERSMGDSGDRAGRQFGVRLNQRLGTGLSASTRVARVGAGAIGAALAAAGLASFAKDSVAMAATFDKTMRQTAAVAKVPQRQMAELRKVALDMGATTSFSARQAGDAMLQLGKGGLTFAQMKAGALSSTLTLAAAGGIELGDAATYVVQGLKVFGLRASQASDVTTALAGAANASVANVEDMGLALAQTGAAANRAGLTVQETTAVLASFADQGVRGSDAGTSLKTMLARLVPQTEKAKGKMEDLGLKFTDARGEFVSITDIAGQLQRRLGHLSDAERETALATIFGSDATRAATFLMNAGEKGIRKYIKATSDRETAEKMAKTNTEGAAGAFERLSGAIETIQIQIGDAFLPKLADAAEWLARVLPQALEKLQQALATVARFWRENRYEIDLIARALTASFTPATEDAASSTDHLARATTSLYDVLARTGEGVARFIQGFNQVGIAAQSISWFIGNAIQAVGHFVNAIDTASKILWPFGDATGHAGDEIIRLGQSMEEHAVATMDKARGSITSAQVAIDGLRTNSRSAAAAADEHAAAVWNEKTAIDALKGALRGEETAELDVRQAKINVSRAQARLTELAKAGRKGSLDYRQAQVDLRRAQLDLRKKTDEYRGAVARSTDAERTAASAKTRAKGAVDRLGDAAQTGGGKADRARIPWRKLGEDVSGAYRQIKNKDVDIIANFGWQGLKVFTPKGGGLKFYAKGGRLPGYGGGDRIPIMAEGGEAVVPKDKANRPEFKAWAGDMGIPGYQRGGRIPNFRMQGQRGMVNALGDWDVQVDKVIGFAAHRFKERLEKSFGALGGGGGPGGWRWQMAVLRSAFPGLPLISGFRPGAITATGNRSYHALGRAVDVPPRMDVFNFIRGTYGANSKELIFTPAGRKQVWNGRPHLYTGITARNHWDHVHWAFDKGGWLMPGQVGVNNTSKPERVIGPAEPVIGRREARLIADELVTAMQAAGLGAVYLDSQRVDRRLATARQWNARRG